MAKRSPIPIEYLKPALEALATNARMESSGLRVVAAALTGIQLYWDLCQENETRLELCAFVSTLMAEGKRLIDEAAEGKQAADNDGARRTDPAGDIDEMHPWEEGI